jgi:hypothetical protein
MEREEIKAKIGLYPEDIAYVDHDREVGYWVFKWVDKKRRIVDDLGELISAAVYNSLIHDFKVKTSDQI